MNCRSCEAVLSFVGIDLNFSPPSNSYLSVEQLKRPETYFPLRVLVCEQCWFVQTEDFVGRDLVFDNDYAYFSSTSTSWLEHAKLFALEITKTLELDGSSMVYEIASNDGYLLQNFSERGIPCLGIEPTLSTAIVARDKGIETVTEFFGFEVASKLKNVYGSADLIIGNNVLAHVPDINDFVSGLQVLLSRNGVCSFEFPHLLNLLKLNQFDTIYHEHFSYLSIFSLRGLFNSHGLRIFRVEKLATHGGSLRVYVCLNDAEISEDGSVAIALQEELDFGINSKLVFERLSNNARKMKIELLEFLIEQKLAGKKVVGYGAAAKGNTFLNYAGVDSDLMAYVVDAALSKQDKYLPGSHIPVSSPERLMEEHPDSILILPWNLADEVLALQIWKEIPRVNFYVAVPHLRQL